MTLPKKNSRTIDIDGAHFRYTVSTSKTDEAGSFKLNLTAQIENGRGCILKAEGLLTRDFWLDFPDVASPGKYPVIGPKHIASIVRMARRKGWVPDENGGPFLLQVASGALQI